MQTQSQRNLGLGVNAEDREESEIDFSDEKKSMMKSSTSNNLKSTQAI